MAEQPVSEETWGKNIVKSITELNHTMGTLRESYQKQNLFDIVTPFDGSSPAQCSLWLSSLNKFTTLHGDHTFPWIVIKKRANRKFLPNKNQH